MQIIKGHADTVINYTLEKICDKKKVIYFDIETTGFSRKYHIVFLIGCMYYENNELSFTQYFAENPNEESIILQEFYKKIASYDTIIHFNGAAFDIPFLTERGKKYEIDFNFDTYRSIDLYKRIKPYAPMLKLENLKQKSVEKLIGIQRTDPFHGGELIEVYHEYVKTKDSRLFKALLMHNMEDVFYMGNLTSLLSFTDLMYGQFQIRGFHFSTFQDMEGTPCEELQISLDIENRLPFLLSYQKDNLYISGKEHSIHLSIRLFNGELKYFFDNYKDYYFLPEEDTALHKSVASFVDKSHRKAATAATCYIKKSGRFLPIFGMSVNNFGELFQSEYKDKTNWIAADKICDENIAFYTGILLQHFGK